MLPYPGLQLIPDLCTHLHLLCPAAPKTQKPKLLKPQPRKVVLVSIPSVLT